MGVTSSASLAGIKSIQRGVITMMTTSSSGTATITAVNTAKAQVTLLGTNFTNDNAYYAARLTLTNATTVTANRGTAINGTSDVSYEVTEWY